jgi:hypothetical protein
LRPAKSRRGTIRFPLDAPVPVTLIGKIARLRVEEVAAKKVKGASVREARDAILRARRRVSCVAYERRERRAAGGASPNRPGYLTPRDDSLPEPGRMEGVRDGIEATEEGA